MICVPNTSNTRIIELIPNTVKKIIANCNIMPRCSSTIMFYATNKIIFIYFIIN